MRDADLTPRQVEFQDRLTAMLQEYAADVGPEFGGQEEGIPVAMPAPVAWILITDWDDIAEADNSSTVCLNSGARQTQRVGMLRIALDMAASE